MMSVKIVLGFAGCWVALIGPAALAGEAAVVAATIAETAAGLYRFDVTVRHQDSGWEHYADRWEVVAPEGRVLGVRTLLHPHVDEQPFTRSLSGVAIPAGVSRVILRAHDLVHEFGGREVSLRMPR